jgi:hypothetical protein
MRRMKGILKLTGSAAHPPLFVLVRAKRFASARWTRAQIFLGSLLVTCRQTPCHDWFAAGLNLCNS